MINILKLIYLLEPHAYEQLSPYSSRYSKFAHPNVFGFLLTIYFFLNNTKNNNYMIHISCTKFCIFIL